MAFPDDRADVDVHHRAGRRRVPPRATTSTTASTARSPSGTSAGSRWPSTSTPRSSTRSPSRASRSSRTPSTSPTRSGSTTSSTCRSTTWARWRTPARDLPRRVPPPLAADPRVLRAARQHHPARDGAHVVRRPRHDEVVGRPLAQRVVRRVGLPPRDGAGDGVHRRVDRLHQRPQELGLPPGPAALDAPHRRRQLRPRGGRGQLRRHHLRQGRVDAQAAGGVGRQGRVPRRPARLLQGARVRATPSSATCSAPWRRPPAASSTPGPSEWLQTSGVNTLAPRFEVDEDGALHVVRASPRPRRRDFPTLRRHRIGVGLYDRRRRAPSSGARRWRSTSRASRTEVPELVGHAPARPAAAQRRRPHLRQDPPRRALAGHPRRRASTRSTTRSPGRCAGARPGT